MEDTCTTLYRMFNMVDTCTTRYNGVLASILTGGYNILQQMFLFSDLFGLLPRGLTPLPSPLTLRYYTPTAPSPLPAIRGGGGVGREELLATKCACREP